ncbi:MAG: ORF6N domain-containing protein [Planctomycetes bacterium]|nr:ORF6N domain-containing protein [Planctomycetota bacterium]
MSHPTKHSRSRPDVLVNRIATSIHFLRGERVLLDRDLAAIYGVETKALNRAVRRNPARFPGDFAFQLTRGEHDDLRYQTGTSRSAHGGTRHPPLVFTEHGAIMAACVLNSARAVTVSILVVRAFVRMRRVLAAHEELKDKLMDLERKYDASFKVVFDALRQLLDAEEAPDDCGPPIGFRHSAAPRPANSNRPVPVGRDARRARGRVGAR